MMCLVVRIGKESRGSPDLLLTMEDSGVPNAGTNANNKQQWKNNTNTTTRENIFVQKTVLQPCVRMNASDNYVRLRMII